MVSIHPTAIVYPGAEIHPTVKVEPYAIIGSQVSIGANTTIGSHAVIQGFTKIGEDNKIYPGAAIGLEPQDLKYKGANSKVVIGNRNTIREYVTINKATEENEITAIGNNNLLMAYSHVAHNCTIEDEVILANSVAMAGHVHIESQAVISGVLGIHQFVRIGKMAMVGGMSKITRDVPPYMLVDGNPARVRSLNFVGLKRRGFSSQDIRELKKAFRIIYHQEDSLDKAIALLDSISDGDIIKNLKDFILLSLEKGRRGIING